MIKKMSHLTNIVSVKSFNCFLSFVIFSKKIVYTEYIVFFFRKMVVKSIVFKAFFSPTPIMVFTKTEYRKKTMCLRGARRASSSQKKIPKKMAPTSSHIRKKEGANKKF